MLDDLIGVNERELAILEMAGRHQPQPLRLFLIGSVGDVHEVADHALDQLDQRRS